MRLGTHGLAFDFKLVGALAALRIPALAATVRRDGLWRHTCFEAFVKPAGGSAYAEYNFSPSSEWAAYGFADYRQDMTPLALASMTTTASLAESNGIGELDLAAALSPAPWQGQALLVGLSAVIEETDGTKSYWALRHPPGPPDFHHPDCFALTLAAPDAA